MSTVPWWAPYISAAVTAIVVGGFSLASTFFAGKSAKRLTEETMLQQRRALLHADRIAAYQSFRHVFFDWQVANSNSTMYWHARTGASKRLERDTSQDSIQYFDSVDGPWRTSVQVVIQQSRLLQFALADLEIVASGPVRSAALAMRTLAEEIRKQDLEVISDTEEHFKRWQDVSNRRRDLQELEERLVVAIQAEFGVDSLG